MRLFLATRNGVVAGHREDGQWRMGRRTLPDHDVTSITSGEGVLLAGTTAGIFHSQDEAQTWQEAGEGLSVPHVRSLVQAQHDPAFFVAGTEPAGIFTSGDGGSSWQECPEVAEFRREFGWYLPYSPEAGCIRGLAFQGERGYAAAEDGAVLRSDDGGREWRLAPGSAGRTQHRPTTAQVHSDVHAVTVHPTSPDLVWAATGGGLFTSSDGGETWENLYRCYCRDVWVDPQDAARLIFGPADGVDRRGRIEESHDGGRSWQLASAGLDVPWARHMVERLVQVGEDLMAVLSNGQLAMASLSELQWRVGLSDAGWVRDVEGVAWD